MSEQFLYDKERLKALMSNPSIAAAQYMPSWAYLKAGSQTEFFQFISNFPGQYVQLNEQLRFYIKVYVRDGEILGRFVTNNPAIADQARKLCSADAFRVFSEERLLNPSAAELARIVPQDAVQAEVVQAKQASVPIAPESEDSGSLPVTFSPEEIGAKEAAEAEAVLLAPKTPQNTGGQISSLGIGTPPSPLPVTGTIAAPVASVPLSALLAAKKQTSQGNS
jgi:hypothetical protein